jgi:hypothetical protein
MDYMLKRWSVFARFLRRRLYLTVQQCSGAWRVFRHQTGIRRNRTIKLISHPKYE